MQCTFYIDLAQASDRLDGPTDYITIDRHTYIHAMIHVSDV